MNTIILLNSLDPDQARQNVGPDLGQNCLQRLTSEHICTLFACWEILTLFLPSVTFFQNLFFRNTIRVSRVWIQIGPKVQSGSDLGSNCLQRLSADGTNM